MTAIPLSAEDEAAAQLIVGRIIGRTKLQEEPMVPANVVRRQLAAVGQDMVAMQKKIDSLRAALKPLADLAFAVPGDSAWYLTMGHARAARKALEEE